MMALKPPDHPGVEGLHAVQARIALQQRHGLLAQLLLAGVAFDFHNQRRAAVHQLQHLGEQGHLLLGAKQAAAGKLLVGHFIDVPLHPAGAAKGAVVVDHHLAVLGQLHIQLHAEAAPGRQLKGHQGVLRHALLPVVQAPVGVVVLVEGGEIRLGELGPNGPQPQQQHQRQREKRR